MHPELGAQMSPFIVPAIGTLVSNDYTTGRWSMCGRSVAATVKPQRPRYWVRQTKPLTCVLADIDSGRRGVSPRVGTQTRHKRRAPPAHRYRPMCTTSSTRRWGRRSPTVFMTSARTADGCRTAATTTPPRSPWRPYASVNRRCLGVRRLRWPATIKIGACQLRTPTGPVKVRMSLLLEVLAADEGCSSSGFSQLCRHIPGCPRRYYNLDPIPQWKKY